MKAKLIIITILILVFSLAVVQATPTYNRTITISGSSYTNINGFTSNNSNEVAVATYYKTTAPVGAVISYFNTTNFAIFDQNYVGGTANTVELKNNVISTFTTSNTIIKRDFDTLAGITTLSGLSLLYDFEIVGDKIYGIKGSTVYIYNYTDGTHIEDVTIPFSSSGITYKDETFYITSASGNNLRLFIYQEDLTYTGEEYTLSVGLLSPDFRDTNFINNNLYVLDINNDKLVEIIDLPTAQTDFVIIDGYYLSKTYCVDDYYLCNDTQFIDQDFGFDLYCDFDDLERCAGTCETASTLIGNQTVQEGYCELADCTNECSFNTYQYCDSTTSYQKCGNYDSDPCLEYSGSIQCLADDRCAVTGSQNYGECISINYTEYNTTINYPSYALNPRVTSTETTIYTKDGANRYNVETENTLHTQTFLLQPLTLGTTLYYSKNCDYKETQIFYDDFSQTNLTNNGWSTDIYELVNSHLYINDTTAITKTFTTNDIYPTYTINFIPQTIQNESKGKISLRHVLGDGAIIYYERNSTTKSISFYEANTTDNKARLLFTDTSTATYDDLTNVEIKFTFNINTYYYDAYITLTRNNEVSYQTIPLSTYNLMVNADSLRFTNTKGVMEIINLEGIEYNEPEAFFIADEITNTFTCSYSTTGCKTVRTYINGNTVEVYNNYKDYTICINKLDTSISDLSNTGNDFFDNLKDKPLPTRLFYTLGVMLGIFIIVQNMKKESDDEYQQLFNLISIIIPIGVLLLAGLSGFIEGWIILIMAVISAFIVSVFFKNKIFGGN